MLTRARVSGRLTSRQADGQPTTASKHAGAAPGDQPSEGGNYGFSHGGRCGRTGSSAFDHEQLTDWRLERFVLRTFDVRGDVAWLVRPRSRIAAGVAVVALHMLDAVLQWISTQLLTTSATWPVATPFRRHSYRCTGSGLPSRT